MPFPDICSIFVGAFSFLVFKRKQYVYQWLGILICVCGVGIVGLASVHDTPASGSVSKSIIGGVLVILGMFSASVRGRCAAVWCFCAST